MAATHFSGPVVSPGGFVGPISGALTSVTQLTDSSGGTANNTIAAIPAATAADTDTSAASLASTNASIDAITDGLADLAAKVNAIIAAMD